MRNYVKKKGKNNNSNKIIEKIIDEYEESDKAIKNNAYNEKVVSKVINSEIKKNILKKVNTINKKNMNKPINTRKLIS